MSVNSIIDTTSIDPDYKDKIFPDLIPWNHPAGQQGLGSVLQVNSSAFIPNTTTAQDATDFATLGCVKIETGTVGMGNQPALVIGEVGDLLQIKGGTLLGSILAGNGVNTETLPLGTNGYVLTADSGMGVGLKWASAGGAGVASITAGTNIGVSNTIPTAPVVSLLSPLTAELNIGSQSIRDSAGAVGTNGQVLTAGTGAQTLWGTNGVSSVTAGTNISITGTASVPVVNLGTAGVLTSTLNTGTQNIQGTSTQFTLTNGGSQSNVQANLGFTSVVQATPTTKANLFNTNISVETLANKVQMTPTYLLKTVGATAFQVGTVGSAPLTLVGAGGGADGISITQVGNVGTTLTTNLSNVKYYPDTYLSNNDSITQGVPAPQVTHQRLTLNNLGLTNTNNWTDYGNAVYAGYSAFTIDSGGNYWYAEQGSGNITVEDSNFVIVAQLQLNQSGNPGTINTFYQQGGYMFIGGIFDSVADAGGVNATPQYSIARVLLSTYFFDPMEDPTTSNRGFTPADEVFCITDVAGSLCCGGTFTTNSLGTTTIRYIGLISNPYVAGSNQVWTEFGGGVSAPVYAIYLDGVTGYVWVGGDFSFVDINGGSLNYTYCAYYDLGTSSWGQVALNNILNSVKVIKPTSYNVIFVAGNFPQVAGTGQNYNTYIDQFNPSLWSDTTLSLGSPVDYKEAHYSGIIGVWDSASSVFQQSSALQVWTSLGDPTGSGTLTGVNYTGSWQVIYSSYNYVREHSVLPHSCEFQGSFMYDNTSYTKYTIVPRNVSQQFIGDITCSFWSIIGGGVGTFSN